jgi:hypothetical protein
MVLQSQSMLCQGILLEMEANAVGNVGSFEHVMKRRMSIHFIKRVIDFKICISK